jgi:alkylation response protein AidB-like acyl-CoA dehydrogenase
MPESILSTARRFADDVLLPRAIETDAAELVPEASLDALADLGFYGLVGPPDAGGLGADLATAYRVVEALAGGCLTTTFVWVQHTSPVLLLSGTPSERLRADWLPRLCSGECRAGIALSAFRPDRPHVRATPAGDGYVFDGVAPWVTGWGRTHVLLTSALTADGQLIRALVDAAPGATLSARRLDLVAANASGTVELSFAHHEVSRDRVVTEEPYVARPPYDGGGRLNGSLALGVAGRCCQMMGATALDAELEARRRQLDVATDETMAEARGAAVELAMRAATALVVTTGSSALLRGHHAQRLAREAIFLLTFGTRPAIRAALLRDLRTVVE